MIETNGLNQKQRGRWAMLTTGCSNQEDVVGQVRDMQGPSKLRSRIGLFLPQKTTDFN